MLVEIERAAAAQHRVSERRGLVAIEAAQKRGHQKCRHLIVGHVPRDVRAEQRAPLARLDASAIAFCVRSVEWRALTALWGISSFCQRSRIRLR